MERDSTFEEFLLNLEPQCSTPEKAYAQLRLKLIKYFTWRRCEDSDALADETVSRLLKSLLGQNVSAAIPYRFVYGIATNVYHEALRNTKKRGAMVSGLDENLAAFQSAIGDCQRECLKKLPVEQLELLEAYYLDDQSRETLAQSQGTSLNSLRLQIHRLKYKFRLCYEDCIRQNRLVDSPAPSRRLN